MTPSLIDQRPRGELIAELYDRHAAGLFAYCHDQLGDTASAADALTAVLTNVPVVEPPRAALYALARREIYRRDVAYVLPSVDPAADPATALVERVVREIRPHQREVLLLSAVCGLDTAELAWVLDVAADTAEQLELGARHRFTHSLTAAVAAARSGGVPPQPAEVYGALAIGPAEDALARLPWRRPSGGLRVKILSAIPEDAGTTGGARPGSKRLWPTTPRWPLPLAEPDPFTNTGVFPAKELSPPEPGRRSRHEATTEPMPKIRAPRAGASDTPPKPRRRRHAGAASVPLAAPVAEAAPIAGAAPVSPDALVTPDVPVAAAETPIVSPDTLVAAAGAEAPPADGAPAVDGPSAAGSSPGRSSSFSKALATGNWPNLRRKFADGRPSPVVDAETADAVTSAPAEAHGAEAEPETTSAAALTVDAVDAVDPGATVDTVGKSLADGSTEPATAVSVPKQAAAAENAPERGARPRRHERPKPIKLGEHHYDWLWELAGFILCVAIAMIVFFSVPTIVTP
ncbi:hypothetical protein OG589_30220 [Sphaerisporangium sp. NBC_01403]|uniref:hypothetical protein n=1 Tax=Sphaerisporangium sp. NBC_01403 TaxID=2903599 RepID=UPI003252BBF7